MNYRQARQNRMAADTAQVFITLMNTVGVEAKGPACLQAAATIVAASFTAGEDGDDREFSGGSIVDWSTDRAAWIATQEKAMADAQAVADAAASQDEVISLETWLDSTPWADVLDGWAHSGFDRQCGCETWTAPGVHDSPKSAVTHECGDHVDGGRLHVWTDNPTTGTPMDDEVAAGNRDFSKLQAAALLYFDGDVLVTMDAAGIAR